MHLRYPGNDPENGPARWQCADGHLHCDICGKTFPVEKMYDDETCEGCANLGGDAYRLRDQDVRDIITALSLRNRDRDHQIRRYLEIQYARNLDRRDE